MYINANEHMLYYARKVFEILSTNGDNEAYPLYSIF